jgi:tetratricopeptide (TPR) repeat protein
VTPIAADQTLQEALALHRQGKLALAMDRYAKVLQSDPRNPDALYYVAVIAVQEGQFNEGIKLAQRALAFGSSPARAHNLLGQTHLRLGQPTEALAYFDRAIECEPALADAHGNRANLLADLGRSQEALAGFDRALALRPSNPDDWCNRGAVLDELGRIEEAFASYEKAVACSPDFAPAHYNRGNLLRDLNRFEEALEAYDRAVEARPDFAEAHSNRGATLRNLGQLAQALDALDRAIDLRPNFAEAMANRGHVLREMGRLDAAEAEYRRALKLSPNLASAHLGLGHVLLERGQIEPARAAIERAIAIDPAPNSFMSLSHLQLLVGEWPDGWESYEKRNSLRVRRFTPLPYPRWTGEPLRNERLVLISEQGIGDTLQFSRFASHLAARGLSVSLLVMPAMAPLLSTLRGVEIITSVDDLAQNPKPIRWLPLMSVARVMKIEPGNVPAEVPYLFADRTRVELWKRRLGGDGLKIGIAWRGGISPRRMGNMRSFPLSTLAPLAAIEGSRLISLQLGPGTEEIATVDFADRIEQFGEDFDGGEGLLLDTAAVMSHLDVVVSCDTSIAHLAGALARPVFIALPHFSEWRWLRERDDTPWYPTARLFRQSSSGDWLDVMNRIADAVRAMARPHS